jgi:thiol-disulfide isomerase/thioredoxin
MKTFLLLFLIFFFSLNLQSQVNWTQSFDEAKLLAEKYNKLILIDFGAYWCIPCRNMDFSLWKDPEMYELAEKFIGLKIDVTFDKLLAVKYKVQAIPKIVLTSISGETIWEKTGFCEPSLYFSILRELPDNVSPLYVAIHEAEGLAKDWKTNYLLGIEYQKIGKDLKSQELKGSFLRLSNQYFLLAEKYNSDQISSVKIDLNLVLNLVYMGNHKRALKNLEKIDTILFNDNLSEFRHYILTKCYEKNQDLDISHK